MRLLYTFTESESLDRSIDDIYLTIYWYFIRTFDPSLIYCLLLLLLLMDKTRR